MTDEHNAQIEPNVRVTDEMVSEKWKQALRMHSKPSRLAKLIAFQMADELERDGVTEADIDRLFPDREKAALSSAPVPPIAWLANSKVCGEPEYRLSSPGHGFPVYTSAPVLPVDGKVRYEWIVTFEDGRQHICALNPGLGPSGNGIIVAVERMLASPPRHICEEEVESLRAALEELLHAVCSEAGFANAVRQVSGFAYPWPALDEAEAKAREALQRDAQGGGE